MHLSPTTNSRDWAPLHAALGTVELLAPSPATCDGRLYVAVGVRDSAGRSIPHLLHIADDLGSAELVGGQLIPAASLPEFAVNGAVPTQLTITDTDWSLVYSGFASAPGGYQLLSGTATGKLGMSAHRTQLLLPALPGQDTLRASAWQDRSSKEWVYAAGTGWQAVEGRQHPRSALWQTGDPQQGGRPICLPGPDEFALTRPVWWTHETTRYLFCNKRTLAGRYCQALAVQDGTAMARIDQSLTFDQSADGDWMYCHPFRWQNRDLAVMATSRVGAGGFTVAELMVT